jgi:hypothetical protein
MNSESKFQGAAEQMPSKRRRPQQKKDLVLRTSGQELNIRFYRSLDENFLLNKVATLYLVANEFTTFKPFAESSGFDFEQNEKSFLDAIRAEIHFTESHQAESLFALLLAILQPLPHWAYLTRYETKEIRKAVEGFVQEDIKSLTSGRLDNVREFIELAVYTGVRSADPEKLQKWETNLDNIGWILKRIGEKFLDATAEYNSYKHGLRIHAGGSALSVYPDGHPEQATTLIASPDSLTFLELKDRGEGGLTIHETTKHFSVKESYAHLVFMARLIKAIKSTRLGTLTKAERVELPTFFELDRGEISKLAVVGRWSFTV